MSESPHLVPGRPSSWWVVLGALCLLLAVGFIVAAFVLQREASAPIGECELFAEDARAASTLEAPDGRGSAVREVRNQLEIEAVSIAGADGLIFASASPSLVGRAIANEFLEFSINQGRAQRPSHRSNRKCCSMESANGKREMPSARLPTP